MIAIDRETAPCTTFALWIALASAGCASAVSPVRDATARDDSAAIDTPDAADLVDGSDACDQDVLALLPVDPQSCGIDQMRITCSAGASAWSFCVTSCASAADCHDPCFPHCASGGCTSLRYCWPLEEGCGCGICAPADAAIATPSGERPIATIVEGDAVFGTRGDRLVAVRVVRVTRRRVWDHSLVRLVLSSGRVVEMSAGHPTFDGTPFASVARGDDIGGARVDRVETVRYEGEYTYDLLTDGDRGAYVASGTLVGSTLW